MNTPAHPSSLALLEGDANRLIRNLKVAFPDSTGFSTRRLEYMAVCAQHCSDGQFGHQSAAQLHWFHAPHLIPGQLGLPKAQPLVAGAMA